MQFLKKWSLVLACSVVAITSAQSEAVKFDAVLKEHAILPAQTFTVPPVNAPRALNAAGRFINGSRNEVLNSDIVPASGLAVPFAGQAIQGFSGIRALGDNRFLVLTDNGFGTRANSSDAMLMFHFIKIDWQQGRPAVEKTIFLKDPNRVVPFPITNENTSERYLTGADFDPESIQYIGDTFWIGEEFGPYLIKLDKNGIVLDVFATEVGGVEHKSPDNPFVKVAPQGDAIKGINTGRSGGYEGMALSVDNKTLYPLLEKPFYLEESKEFEQKSGHTVLRMFEFDPNSSKWSDKIRYYPLEDATHAIGDFNMIDENRGLIIERDSFEGDPRDSRNEKPAAFKRVYLVDINQLDKEGVVKKIGYIDLMDIKDPNKKGRTGVVDGVLNFPFVTIENVDMIDDSTIIIANDNNYPFSTGRQFGKADDNEFILLDVKDFLAAK